VEVEVLLHAFLTAALDAGGWSDSHPDHITPKKETLLPTEYETVWAPEFVSTLWRRE
jgi:hypothetical protein